MIEEFEYDGMWWLPEKPNNKVSGKLKFHPVEGLKLQLIGSFKELKDFNTFLQPLIILGIISNGGVITLYKCYESQSHMSVLGFLSSSFIASVAFLGCHFRKEEEIRFDFLSLNYSHLEEWTGITGFQFKMETDSKNHLTKHEVIYSFPEKVEAKIGNLSIFFDYNFTSGGDRLKEVNLKHTTFIKIKPSKSLHFNDYQDVCYHIQNFLSLAIGKAVFPVIIKGKSERCSTKSQNGKAVYPDIFIYYATNSLLEISSKIYPFDMLFTFRDISDKFESILKNWFEKAEMLKPVYDLYFGTLYNPRMYLQHKFLSMTQAVEAYHRRKFEGKYLSDEDYEPIQDRFKDIIKKLDVEASFKEALKSKLKYGNEYSLRKRLKDLFVAYQEITQNFIKDEDNFINRVIDTRNYLTHYDKKLRSIANGKDLYCITQKLKIILQTCLLYELGFDRKEIKSIFLRNRRYRDYFG